MKIYKFLSVALLAIAFSSCSKHTVEFNATPAGDDMAEFQLHYFEAISATAVNYIDSVFVNDVLYSSVNGSGQLLLYNGVPGGGVGRFFTVKSGENNLKLYRKGNIVYDQTITLAKGKQNVFVYDMNKAPIILDNGHPYQQDRPSNPETWGTDSIAYVDFYNFLFETPGVPYSGKLQYQYKAHSEDVEWQNIGEAVAFGEATERVQIRIHKEVFNSSGRQKIDYRILTEDGSILQVMNSKGVYYNFSDYWFGYIGRSYMHIFCGNRSNKSVRVSIKQWTSL